MALAPLDPNLRALLRALGIAGTLMVGLLVGLFGAAVWTLADLLGDARMCHDSVYVLPSGSSQVRSAWCHSEARGEVRELSSATLLECTCRLTDQDAREARSMRRGP